MVSNFNPVYMLQPILSILIVGALVIAYRRKGLLPFSVFLFAAIAYFGAIILKVVLQAATVGFIVSTYGTQSVVTGLYYGFQTVVFEVFGAYLVAFYASKWIQQKFAGGYGISLAFMENAILLGLLPLIELVIYYVLLSSPSSPTSIALYNLLHSAQPTLFSSTSVALPLVGYSVLERVSSLFLHYSWGFLVVTAVNQKKLAYLLIALPFGLVDALVPFAGSIGLGTFEALLFCISLCALGIAIYAGKRLNKRTEARTA